MSASGKNLDTGPKNTTEIVEALQAQGFDAHIVPGGDVSVHWCSSYWARPYINIGPGGAYTVTWSRTGMPPYPEYDWDRVVNNLYQFRRETNYDPYHGRTNLAQAPSKPASEHNPDKNVLISLLGLLFFILMFIIMAWV